MTAGKWIALLGIVALVGCATGPAVPLALPESDAAAKQFMASEGGANLYIARRSDSDGQANSFDVIVDERALAGC